MSAQASSGPPEEWAEAIAAFVHGHVERAGAAGVVVGLSGGLDSSVAAALAVQALGKGRVVGVWLPAESSRDEDAADARTVAEWLGLEFLERPVAGVVAAVLGATGASERGVVANATARARMVVLYAQAQSRGMLVCGTGNKSELLTGYFTKHGDGGCDLLPIGDLYKTQVQELAAHLGVPEAVQVKPPSAGLWEGQTDEDDLGLPYAELDRVLKGFEFNAGVEEVARRTGLAPERVAHVDRLVRASEHKRRTPLVPKLGVRTVGIDWRRSVHWDAGRA